MINNVKNLLQYFTFYESSEVLVWFYWLIRLDKEREKNDGLNELNERDFRNNIALDVNRLAGVDILPEFFCENQ